jgi:superfamily II DNA or RNA helicase
MAGRREVLRQFANGIDAAGQRVHRAFLASGRVLGEGVDITGERGVEAICFADTRGSQVEIVQNIGRALRLNRAPPVMTGFGRRERIDYAPSVSRAGPRRRARRRVAFTTVCSFKDG